MIISEKVSRLQNKTFFLLECILIAYYVYIRGVLEGGPSSSLFNGECELA